MSLSGFIGLLVFSFLLLVSCFSTTRMSFITVVIFIELLNVLVLLVSFWGGSLIGWFMYFLSFIVVATMEVVISLVSLTRVWSLGTFVY